MVDAAQRDGVDAEQRAEVVVADVLEVPARARVARHARLPPRVVDHDVGGRAGEQASTPASSGTFAKARHSAAKRTPARRASSRGAGRPPTP